MDRATSYAMAKITTILITDGVSRAGTCVRLAVLALVLLPCSPVVAGPVGPHWDKGACEVCHQSATPAVSDVTVRDGTAAALCEQCHAGNGGARPCRHVSGIVPGGMKIPPGYEMALDDGKVVCTTCHDLTIQCEATSPSHRFTNPGFVRGRKSRERGAQCFQCHEAAGFDRLNPHQMQAGDPPGSTCTLCHASEPKRDERGWLAVDFNAQGSLNDLCTGCHEVQPHPGSSFSGKPIGWEHLAVPSAEIQDNMRRSEATQGLVFPLQPGSGEIHCATCHNPHPQELEGYPAASTVAVKDRLRVDKICQACHDM